MEDDNNGVELQNPGEDNRDAQKVLTSLNAVVAALQNLNTDELRERVLQAAAAFFRLSFGSATSSVSRHAPFLHSAGPGSSFSEDRTISPKDFLRQKQPRTEVERVACLAYYLTHYRDSLAFKTIDISTLNTEAAAPKFVNASQAVENALKTHYLAQAAKGAKQLSGAGEAFVQALPDREAARLAMATMKPRKRKRMRQQNTSSEPNAGNE